MQDLPMSFNYNVVIYYHGCWTTIREKRHLPLVASGVTEGTTVKPPARKS